MNNACLISVNYAARIEPRQAAPSQAEPNQTQPNRTKAKRSETCNLCMAEGRQPRRVGEIGACGEALSKYERNQEQFDGNAYVMPCARCLPPSALPTTLLCPALDWTHVGQSGLPLAVKLFNWSLIGCDCSALGGTARCRACFLTLQAKVMIPTAAPASAPALPLFAGRSHFIFCFAPSAK